MALNIGGATVEGSGAFTIKNTSDTTIFDRALSAYSGSTYAKNISANTPMFQAGDNNSGLGWTSLTSGAWNKVTGYLTATSINVGNHYDTTNTRFNVPITGPYLFVHSSYIYTSNYIHPLFSVNGDVSARRYNTPYRIRSHGMVANYQQDAQSQEVIYCTAGDYVEFYMYNSGTGYYYPRYSTFAGIYVG